MPGSTATMWDGLSGQARQSAAVTDVSREMNGAPSMVQPSSSSGAVHSSGWATNSAASAIDKALMNKAAMIVAVAAIILIIEGAVAFRGHTL